MKQIVILFICACIFIVGCQLDYEQDTSTALDETQAESIDVVDNDSAGNNPNIEVPKVWVQKIGDRKFRLTGDATCSNGYYFKWSMWGDPNQLVGGEIKEHTSYYNQIIEIEIVDIPAISQGFGIFCYLENYQTKDRGYGNRAYFYRHAFSGTDYGHNIYPEYESNNDVGHAQLFFPSTVNLKGKIDYSSNYRNPTPDYFVFSNDRPTTYRITLTGNYIYVNWSLYHSSNLNDRIKFNGVGTKTVNLTSTGDYYIKVHGYSGVKYTLDVDIVF